MNPPLTICLLDIGENTTQRQVEITADHVKAQVGDAAAMREIILTDDDATIRVGNTVSVVVTETGIVITGGAVTVTGSAVTVSGSSVAVTGTTTVNSVAVASAPAGTSTDGALDPHNHTLTGA